jgi:hypothetical protein
VNVIPRWSKVKVNLSLRLSTTSWHRMEVSGQLYATVALYPPGGGGGLPGTHLIG